MTDTQQLDEMTERLGSEALGKLLVRLSVPSIVSMVTISSYSLVNVFWLGKLGYRFVAAVTVTMPFWVLCLAIGVGTGVGANALASRLLGEGNTDSANQVAGQMFFLAFAIGIPVAFATTLFPETITRLCGATSDVIDLANQYVALLGWGMPFLFLGSIGRNVFNACGDAIRPMVFIIFGQITTAVLDPFLIFGWGLFPTLSISGAAMATIIGNVLSSIMIVYYLVANKTAYRLRLRHLLPRPSIIVEIYRVGLPTTIMEMTESVVFALYNNVVAGFGSIALAATGIAGRIIDVLFMPVFGISQGLLPIVGFSFGAKLWKRLWSAVKVASAGTAFVMAVASVCLEILAPQVVAIFTGDPELQKLATLGTRIMVSSLCLIGPTIMFITTFQGLSKAKEALVLSLARQFVFFLPGLFLLPRFMGLHGVWLSSPVAEALALVAAGLWIYREYNHVRKTRSLDDPGMP
jgi:putative MATE family efflux protein